MRSTRACKADLDVMVLQEAAVLAAMIATADPIPYRDGRWQNEPWPRQGSPARIPQHTPPNAQAKDEAPSSDAREQGSQHSSDAALAKEQKLADTTNSFDIAAIDAAVAKPYTEPASDTAELKTGESSTHLKGEDGTHSREPGGFPAGNPLPPLPHAQRPCGCLCLCSPIFCRTGEGLSQHSKRVSAYIVKACYAVKSRCISWLRGGEEPLYVRIE